jgi:hypothetical protein
MRNLWEKYFKKKKKDEEIEEVPEEWVADRVVKTKKKSDDQPLMKLVFEGQKKEKKKIPWLRNLKRGLAALMVLPSFFFACASFNEIPMFLMFTFYTFILIDYLWKTKEIKEAWPKK